MRAQSCVEQCAWRRRALREGPLHLACATVFSRSASSPAHEHPFRNSGLVTPPRRSSSDCARPRHANTSSQKRTEQRRGAKHCPPVSTTIPFTPELARSPSLTLVNCLATIRLTSVSKPPGLVPRPRVCLPLGIMSTPWQVGAGASGPCFLCAPFVLRLLSVSRGQAPG